MATLTAVQPPVDGAIGISEIKKPNGDGGWINFILNQM